MIIIVGIGKMDKVAGLVVTSISCLFGSRQAAVTGERTLLQFECLLYFTSPGCRFCLLPPTCNGF